jgi:hypothetical protein
MTTNHLEPLLVLDRMTVGPVRMETRRLMAPYRISIGGAEHSSELIYSYEEDVFDSSQRLSRNIASMIAAQVALNYGLFCREIVFDGEYDTYDRHFLKEMAANTAREIFVNKILKPTGFIIGKAASMPPIRVDSYLQSRISFKRRAEGEQQGGESWSGEQCDCAVLSSGGKDSLLSFGLLHEVGTPVHPIFINESGRHWYTALNAYRHFRSIYPLTCRIWTNADRLFNWMLRHLPFVRRDYQRMRSDVYPIRLWTVAVFLFGALPLLRKRGIGRLILGDENDTTRLKSHEGIPHYDGLYDQSLYFDSALSRYFSHKGWNISQFSILRSLTEILIEKILVERYHDLQRHQMSCHAAHTTEARIYPCGNCEKCRRIVSLLVAIGADPKWCGYTRKQIDRGLEALKQKGIHQELEDMEALYALLVSRGVLSPLEESPLSPCPEKRILRIRVDPIRSPIEGIPEDLRYPLFKIFSEHSYGAMRRKENGWTDIDIVEAVEAAGPYRIDFYDNR